MSTAPSPAPAARRLGPLARALWADAAWAAAVAAVSLASRSPLLPGADLRVAWPVLGLVVLWALRRRTWRERLLVLAAAAVVVLLTAAGTPGTPLGHLAGAAALVAGAATAVACLDALGVGSSRTREAWAVLAASLGGAVVAVLVQAVLGDARALTASSAPAELVRVLAGSFVVLAAAHRVPGLLRHRTAEDQEDAEAAGAAAGAAASATAGPAEAAAVWLGGLGLVALLFGVLVGVPVSFAAFPVVVWAALRLPPRWAAVHLLATCSLVVGGAVAGRGPFAGQGPAGAVVLAHACACVLALLVLVVALHREQREVAERRLAVALAGAREHAGLLGAVHAAVSQGIAVYAADGALLLANPAARAVLGDNPREDEARSWEGVYGLARTDGTPLATEQLPVVRALGGEAVTGVDLLLTAPGAAAARVLRVDAQPLPQVEGAAWAGGAVAVFADVTDERAEAAAAAQARDLLAGVLDGATTQGIVAADAEHRITVFSSGAERLLGWAAAEVVGGSPLRFVRHAEVHARAAELDLPVGAPVLLAGLAEGGHTTRRWTLVRRDGSTFTGEVTLTQTHDDDGALRSTIAVITDVTAELAADRRRAEAELQFRLAFETAPTGMVLVSLEPGDLGRLTRVNDAFAAFTGRAPEELLAGRVRDLLHPDDVAGHAARLEQIAAERATEASSREQRFVRPDGAVRWARTTPSLVEPADGGPPHLLVVVEDVTEGRRTQEALLHAALHDPLTGLPNRALLAQRLEDALREDAHLLAGVTVLYLDLDGFKPVNDDHGHAAGDELLRVVAARLRRAVRGGDLVARLGGDEFALLCPGLAAAAVPDLLARIDAAVTAPVPLPSGAVVRVSASTGSATAVGEDDAQRLLDEADHSMYAVKRRHRRAAGPVPRARGAGTLPG